MLAIIAALTLALLASLVLATFLAYHAWKTDQVARDVEKKLRMAARDVGLLTAQVTWQTKALKDVSGVRRSFSAINQDRVRLNTDLRFSKMQRQAAMDENVWLRQQLERHGLGMVLEKAPDTVVWQSMRTSKPEGNG